LRPGSFLGSTTNGLLGQTFAPLVPFAFKLGVTQGMLLALIGVAVALMLVLVLLAVGLFGSFGGG
jgi:hypothetical protein